MPDASHAGRMVKDVILEMIQEREGISTAEIAEALDITPGLAQQLINELVADGSIGKADSEVN